MIGRVSRTMAILVTMTAFTAGCSDAQKQRWNEFWGVGGSNKPRAVRSSPARGPSGSKPASNSSSRTASTVRPGERSDAAGAGNSSPEPAGNGDKTASDRANNVDSDVEAYAANMHPPRETNYEPNDHTTKIQRQNDPERRKRIHEAAAHEEADASVTPSASRDDALARYERNTGVSTDAAGESPKSDSPDGSTPKPVDGTTEKEMPSGMGTAAQQPSPSRDAGTSPVVRTVSDRAASEKSAKSNNTGATSDLHAKPEGNRDQDKPKSVESDLATRGHDASSSETSPPSTDTKGAPTVEARDGAVADIGETARPTPDAGPEKRGSGNIRTNQNPKNDSPPSGVDGPSPTETRPGVPELEDISIASAPEPKPAEAADNASGSTVSANTGGAMKTADGSFASRIADLEKAVTADPNNLNEQYRLRMMYLVNGQDEKARSVIPGIDADIQQIITAQIDSLISARSTSGRDPATWATRQLESIETLRRLVKERADLMVPQVSLCTSVDGFGRYKPIEPAEFKAGRSHKVLIYIEIDNFTSKQTNTGMYRTLLSVRQTLLTKDGKEIWSEKAENIEDLARRPRRDFYLCTTPIAIPKTLPPGDYLLKVEVEDVFAGKINSNVATFKIVAG